MNAIVNEKKRVATVTLGGEICTIPTIDQDTYLDYLGVREEAFGEQAERGYTRAQFIKIRDTVRRIYGGTVSDEALKAATPGETIAAFVAVEVAVAGETGDAVEAIRTNFTAGAAQRPM